MSDVINIKDFFDHDKRITIIESAVCNIDRTMERVEKRMDRIESEMKTHFRWTMGSIFGLYAIVTTAMISIVIKLF